MPIRILLAATSLAAVVTAGMALGADKHLHHLAGSIKVEAAWARASAGMAKAGAAYLTIRNIGSTPDRLIAASAAVAQRAELHTHIMTDNVMRMRRIEAVPVAAGGATTLKPGGNHVMLMGLHAPLRKDGQFPLTLTFEKAGDVTVTVNIAGVAARRHGGMGHGSHK